MSWTRHGITPTAPVNLFLNLTSRCNLDCRYCSSPGLGSEVSEELTLDDYRRLGIQFDQIGVFTLILTGGEPLLREDFWDLTDILSRPYRRITLNTNGTLVDRDTALRLKGVPIRDCAVSLDSADESINAVTRGRGALAAALRAIECLQDAGVSVAISATLTAHNGSPIRIRELAILGHELGVSVSLGYVTVMGRAGCEDAGFVLGQQQRVETAQYVLELRREFPKITSNLLSFPLRVREGPGGATILPCDAGKKTAAITADGWVLPCNKMPQLRCGNVRETSIADSWHSPPMQSVRSLNGRLTREIPECADCCHNGYCSGGCRGDALLATGELLRRSPVCYAYSPSGGGKP